MGIMNISSRLKLHKKRERERERVTLLGTQSCGEFAMETPLSWNMNILCKTASTGAKVRQPE